MKWRTDKPPKNKPLLAEVVSNREGMLCCDVALCHADINGELLENFTGAPFRSEVKITKWVLLDDLVEMIGGGEVQEDSSKLLNSAVHAYQIMNTIRARDGVPYTSDGWKYNFSAEYFRNTADDLNDAVTELTGHSAHCHPLLYKNRSGGGE